ncbi:nucleotide-diphospho-sugar transferase [Epithele typhae]|uniref:nucleotide-diphospho-sugar transferase n=1 Tax=Epithele typhae TaxID=378194 RepID=UPI002008A6E3|nr:nucleotide-diphospho-sugar transferase [Epithele typhae]KAH9943492.1 nucleotide-diphospho-sugar transferase [Epithele typhae]
MFRRRTVCTLLCLLATFLVGTVIVLSSVSFYLAIDRPAYITQDELDRTFNDSQHPVLERVPRIIHQTWKSDTLPDRWVNVSQSCKDMMPDYEYMLWTDNGSRDFLAEHYRWFLDTFDGYTYPIQRADAIRYFVLYHYGGVYIDLDMGCLRPMDPLLVYPVILPKTIPVGVSNDLMFAEKGHPFLAQTIHGLTKFDYNWIINYPTVMFSTGPMFLSAEYGAWTSSGEVRILPKALYGKNAKPGEAPNAFFSHFYGSSWHADDAAFIGFLGKWGKGLMWAGLMVFVAGFIRMVLLPRQRSRPRIGGYDVYMPRWTQKNGRWHLDLGWFSLPASGSNTSPPSPIALPRESGSDEEEDMQLLPLYDSSRSASPAPSDVSFGLDGPGYGGHGVVDHVRRAGNRLYDNIFGPVDPPSTPSRSRRRRLRPRGVMFFLPAFLTQEQNAMVDVPFTPHGRTSSYAAPRHQHPRDREGSPSSNSLPPEKQRYAADLARAGLIPPLDPSRESHGRAGSSSSEGSLSSTVC